MVRINNVGSKMSKSLNSMKQNLMSDKLNIIILVLSVVLIALLVYYYVIKKKENYENTEDNKVVLFHVSWCPHCKKILPEWKSLGDSISLDNNICNVIEEQCDLKGNEDAPKRYNVEDRIEGYPTIILFKGEEIIEYNGARTADSIIKWVKEQFN